MQLTRLEIKGFKSFGERIVINFNEGVTAIAGPNGCGKSNVVDAIRWVLGEQSTKTLRSEKMENIIFNGTKTRKPSQLAEVSLSFDNTKNILPTEFAQVTITRKLYRSGDSEYRLNDVQCRLKDITDLFLDTGIGSDSYSIIELKMIDEIIANKEGSRRSLFEESSGISKYKLRKKQTFNKLRDTEADLSRVEDLLSEIEKNLKTLENQAKKAERFYKLKDQYKSLSISLATFRIAGFRTSLETLDVQEEEQHARRTQLAAQISALEEALQKFRSENILKEKNLSVQQKAVNDFASKIRSYENEKKIRNEQTRFLQEKERRISDELEKDRSQYNHVLYNIKRLNEELLGESEKLQLFNSDLQAGKTELDELRLQQQSTKSSLENVSQQDAGLQQELHKNEKELAVLNIQRDSLSQESKRTLQDAESKELELGNFNKALAEVESLRKQKSEELAATEQFELELETKVKTTEEQIQAHKDQLAAKSRKLDAFQNEYNLTKSLIDNLEGFPESIRFLKKNAGWSKQAPLLSDVLFCKEAYRVTIENYLEPVMNHYVVENQDEAVQAIRLLSDSARGRANFFILDVVNKLPPVSLAASSSANIIPALSVIEVDSKYERLCHQLLRNVFIHTGNDKDELANGLPEQGIVILSANGAFIKSRISMSGGSVGLFEGKRIGRAKNLELLDKQIRELQANISELKGNIEGAQEQLINLKASSRRAALQVIRREEQQLSAELISLETRRDQYLEFIQNSKNRKQDIEDRMQQLDMEVKLLEPALDALREKKAALAAELMEKQLIYAELAEIVNEKAAVWNQENLRLHQQQNKVAGIEKDLGYRETQQANLETRMTRSSGELEKAKLEIQQVAEQSDLSEEDISAMYSQKEALEKGLQEAEQDYFTERSNMTESENSIVNLRKQKEQAEVLAEAIKDKKNGLKLDLNALKERLAVEFSIDIADLLEAEIPENDSEEDLRLKTGKLKKQIDEYGAVNSMAMEAFREMNERYTFILEQKKDLAEAKDSLLATIRQIDDTAKGQFMDSFYKVRENFIRVFRSLFNEEDSCDLILSNPQSPLESDIDIIARPKGKRPLSINQLSGGEKTLTATALLFSLYLLKPAPFCIFDEVDAPLDDTNIDKFNNIIRTFSSESQFIVVSHNKRTLASTDIVYGVTMVEQGISRVVPVDLREFPN